MGQEVQADVLDGGRGAGRRWLGLLALHLLPGVVLALVFWLLTKTLVAAGATAYLALILTIPLCLVPVEMGIVLAWSYRTTGRWSVRSALGYGARWGAGEWLWITLLLLLILGLMSLVTGPMSLWLERQLGPWVPVWLTTGDAIGALARVSPAQRWVTVLLAALFSGLVAPVVEEIYFRGFLLAKMESMGAVAPVANAFLFAIYHFYFPWNVPAIFLGFLPIAYAVWKRKNLAISVVTHMAINLLGVVQVAWLAQAL